jgi:hypothetical protein
MVDATSNFSRKKSLKEFALLVQSHKNMSMAKYCTLGLAFMEQFQQ